MSSQAILDHYLNATGRLDLYLATPVVTSRDRMGVIRGFLVAFELAYKAINRAGVLEGLSSGGPRTALSNALTLRLIPASEEEVMARHA